jgi:methionine aminopeptidase
MSMYQTIMSIISNDKSTLNIQQFNSMYTLSENDLANTNKDIYDYIDNYIKKNNLSKAFPIGISINYVIAHDSFHESNVVNLKKGDFIKIDVGLIEDGNIIDCARTFVYKSEIPQCIKLSLYSLLSKSRLADPKSGPSNQRPGRDPAHAPRLCRVRCL